MIRPMRKADLDAVSKLAGQLVRQHHSFDAKRFMMTEDPEGGYAWWLGKQLKDDDTVLLVAEVDKTIAGYFYGGLVERDWARLLDAHGAVHDIFVDAKFRRRGIASELMRAGIEALEKKGAKQVVLSSATQNAEAHALFEKLGFRRTMVEMTRG
jgi:ribosomal protein S18 acetylase RimI-like enzyme